MRIYYHLSKYVSHREAGLEYVECLRALGHTLVLAPDTPERADLAIIHDDPLNISNVFTEYPYLSHMRTVAYAVWEGNLLPRQYLEGLSRVSEIWTCSHFSQSSMLEHFPHVSVVPHVVRRLSFSPQALARAVARTGIDDNSFVFFTVIDAINPRKNVKTLLSAFERLRRSTRVPVRLVLKQYRMALDFSQLPGVTSIVEDLPREDMAALYAVAHAYVSAHHCEGWGLGLSTAMAYGKPVIATGYSGNMEYMNETNSFPVPYKIVPVSDEMSRLIPLFQPEMSWANIDAAALERTMRMVAEKRISKEITRRATAITKKFGPQAVRDILKSLLEKI